MIILTFLLAWTTPGLAGELEQSLQILQGLNAAPRIQACQVAWNPDPRQSCFEIRDEWLKTHAKLNRFFAQRDQELARLLQKELSARREEVSKLISQHPEGVKRLREQLPSLPEVSDADLVTYLILWGQFKRSPILGGNVLPAELKPLHEAMSQMESKAKADAGNKEVEVAIPWPKEFAPLGEKISRSLIRRVFDHFNSKFGIFTRILPSLIENQVAFIEKNVEDPALRKKLIERTRSARFSGIDCPVPSRERYARDTVDNDLARYDEKANSLCVTLWTVMAFPSEENLVRILAHELAHAIDPAAALGLQDSLPLTRAHIEKASAETGFRGIDRCLDSPHLFASDSFGIFNESFADWIGNASFEKYLDDHPEVLKGKDPRGVYARSLAIFLMFDTPGPYDRPSQAKVGEKKHASEARRVMMGLLHPKARKRLNCRVENPELYRCLSGPDVK